MRAARSWLGAALAASAFGCASRPAPPAPDRSYPGVLHPPAELTPDFAVEQHVAASKGTTTGAFDAVVQKRGGELLVVGLGPLGVRAFVLTQVGSEVRAEQRMGPPLPFPARNIVVDVHRVFFKRLPLVEAVPDGVHRGPVDDEEVVEVWREGSLVERAFKRADRTGVVRVLYGPGCSVARCEPASVRLINGWFGYELEIENRRFHAL